MVKLYITGNSDIILETIIYKGQTNLHEDLICKQDHTEDKVYSANEI